MKSTFTRSKAKAVLLIISGVFVQSQVVQAQWTTNGNTINYNSGSVGIGTSNPVRMLHIANTGTEPDMNLALTGAGPSIFFAANHTIPSTNWAKIGLATGAAHYTPTSKWGDFVISSLTPDANMLFVMGPTTKEVARIDKNGYLGIGTTAPTARLHNNGSVRFENLPSGTGNYLVVGSNGNVYVSNQTPGVDTVVQVVTNQAEVTALQEKVAKLEQSLQQLQQLLTTTNGRIELDLAKITNLEVSPNPVTSASTITYSYPSGSANAYVNLSDQTGKLIKRFDVKQSNSSTVNFSLGEYSLTSGIYVISLEVNGKTVQSKQIVIAR